MKPTPIDYALASIASASLIGWNVPHAANAAALGVAAAVAAPLVMWIVCKWADAAREAEAAGAIKRGHQEREP